MSTEKRSACETRIVIAHNCNGSAHGRSLVLQDRKGKQNQGYLVVNGALQELNRFKQKHSSWFIGDRVVSDGGVYISSPVDPIFAFLPVLERSRQQTDGSPGMFCSLEQIFGDPELPQLHQLLETTTTDNAPAGSDDQEKGPKHEAPSSLSMQSMKNLLACVCEVKEACGDHYYRLCDNRVLAWLLCKLKRVKAALHVQLQGMDSSSQDAYAVSFLAEYISDKWKGLLSAHLGVGSSLSLDGPQTASEKRPTGAPDMPAEKKQKVLDPKAAALKKAQESRAKVKEAASAKEAAGSKKISSFFAKISPKTEAK